MWKFFFLKKNKLVVCACNSRNLLLPSPSLSRHEILNRAWKITNEKRSTLVFGGQIANGKHFRSMPFKFCLIASLLLTSTLSELVPEDDDLFVLERLTRILEDERTLRDDDLAFSNIDGSGETNEENDSHLARVASNLIAQTTSTTLVSAERNLDICFFSSSPSF